MSRAIRKRRARNNQRKRAQQQASAKAVIARNASRPAGDAGAAQRANRSGIAARKSEQGSDNTVRELNAKTDFTKGRQVYATVNKEGKTEYLPKESDASDSEKKRGLFIKDSAIEKLQPGSSTKKLSSDSPKMDVARGRKVYGAETVNAAGETVVVFFPRKSDATPTEIDNGAFVEDALINANASDGTPNKILKQRPKYDIGRGRTVYPTLGTDGDGNPKVVYLPRESDASSSERADGLFVKDSEANDLDDERAIAAAFKVGTDDPRYQELRANRAKKRAGFKRTNAPSRADIGRNRRVYPAEVAPGVIKYLPLKSETTAQELRLGLFVESSTFVDENARDAQGRRDVAKLPFRTADDGTPLWDGVTLPEPDVDAERSILSQLKPKYDLGLQRMLYPTETAPDQIEFLPLKEDATREEEANGLFVTLVPEESIDLLVPSPNRPFEVGGQPLKAFAQEAVEQAFLQVENYVLRSNAFQRSLLLDDPAVQQEWIVAQEEVVVDPVAEEEQLENPEPTEELPADIEPEELN